MQTAIARSRPWLRTLGIFAFAVLASCGAVLVAIPPRAHSSMSLASRPNWILAGALPTSRDFPSNWGYGISGEVQRTVISEAPATSTPPNRLPRSVYTTQACKNVPSILNHSGAAFGPVASVDRATALQARMAALMDNDATGATVDDTPSASLEIWVVHDGPAEVAKYLDWLGRCDSYDVANYDYQGRMSKVTVTTAVEAGRTDGADVVATVTRRFINNGGGKPATYHVTYYAVRGVILECSIFMEGADRSLVQLRAAQTVQRLRAL